MTGARTTAQTHTNKHPFFCAPCACPCPFFVCVCAVVLAPVIALFFACVPRAFVTCVRALVLALFLRPCPLSLPLFLRECVPLSLHFFGALSLRFYGVRACPCRYPFFACLCALSLHFCCVRDRAPVLALL
jgi:hypothetical protein